MNIEEIRAREQAATPGPWERDGSHIKRKGSKALVAAVQTFHNPFETADFISAARQDIPDLLSEIDRLTSELEQKNRELEEMKK